MVQTAEEKSASDAADDLAVEVTCPQHEGKGAGREMSLLAGRVHTHESESFPVPEIISSPDSGRLEGGQGVGRGLQLLGECMQLRCRVVLGK